MSGGAIARARAALPMVVGLACATTPAHAADAISVVDVKLDRPTLHALGVQVLINGDDDRDASAGVRYRKQGDTAWREALPLMRVWPETVTLSVPQQLAGSIFDLEPSTTYEIELSIVDPDGGSEVRSSTATTRAPPRLDPLTPNPVNVSDVTSLKSALSQAKPGDVISLAAGTYSGAFFSLNASGTLDSPIVIRGASQAGVVLDGGDCTGCNVLEVYGSHVYVERLTIVNAERAIRFQGAGTTGNVVRHVKIQNVVHGVGSKNDQTDFFICDNVIEGKLLWPWTFQSDATSHWDDRGVDVTGDGHVVCHNVIRGFGDPIVNKKSQSRAWDVYGNDVFDSYDGTELDDSEGNSRLFHNRYTNVMDPISIQPVWGGPTYVLRNVVLNAPEEPIKLKSTGGVNEPSGALIFHNTFVSAKWALNLQTPITQHNFRIENNLFIGPDQLAGSRTVEWTAGIDGGIFDYNGYYPDGGFWFGVVGGTNRVYQSFAEVKSKGEVEQHGVLLSKPIFEAGFVGPVDAQKQQVAADFTLAASSGAIDVGRTLPGINASAVGAGPDLGALELGCPTPTYGPRAEGQDGVTNLVDCNAGSRRPPGSGGGGGTDGGVGASAGAGAQAGAAGGSGGSGTSAGGSAARGSGDDAGCGCRSSRRRGASPWALGILLAGAALLRRRAKPGHRR